MLVKEEDGAHTSVEDGEGTLKLRYSRIVSTDTALSVIALFSCCSERIWYPNLQERVLSGSGKSGL